MTKIFWFMWAPWLWKTVAMNIVENSENLEQIKTDLWKEQDLNVWVVRKSTSRPSRWADDRLKISGVPEQDFIDNRENYIWEYTLVNNWAKYAYSKEELWKDWDILIAEPSIHHLATMKDHLKDNLVVVLIAADTNYRKVRMNWRWTEELSQINKRLIEWDVQIFVASKLSGKEWESLSKLIDPKWLEIYNKIYSSWWSAELLKVLKDYIFDLVWEEEFSEQAAKDYFDTIVENIHKWNDEKLFDYIVVRCLQDDEIAWDEFLTKWPFRDRIVSIIEEWLSKQQ